MNKFPIWRPNLRSGTNNHMLKVEFYHDHQWAAKTTTLRVRVC